ncbi:hypothetical protein ElyMa_000481600 [Elysia marginata]|uniref:Ion transport domain-containing protein n=1 Tax=Elysia marginata TaxID=1093978 RepID=A0AAV4FTE0_9GAST|nr:hypothetical protein ElyMa_000481600 [Elysia marginata]
MSCHQEKQSIPDVVVVVIVIVVVVAAATVAAVHENVTTLLVEAIVFSPALTAGDYLKIFSMFLVFLFFQSAMSLLLSSTFGEGYHLQGYNKADSRLTRFADVPRPEDSNVDVATVAISNMFMVLILHSDA